MDAKLIEKLDHQRYWAVVVLTIAQFEMLVELILWHTCRCYNGTPLHDIFKWLGVPLFICAGLWYPSIEGYILSKRELREVLHDEMYTRYKHRSVWIAFLVVMIALLAYSIVSTFKIVHIPVFPISQLTLWFGLFALSISWLVLNRNRQ